MKIEFATDRCVGHGQCYANAPELFEPDEEGYSKPKLEGDVPHDLEAKARLSANVCPEYAITIVEHA